MVNKHASTAVPALQAISAGIESAFARLAMIIGRATAYLPGQRMFWACVKSLPSLRVNLGVARGMRDSFRGTVLEQVPSWRREDHRR